METPQLGIGIIGTGFGATVQLPAFLTMPSARVIGIASRQVEKSQQLAQAHRLPRSFASWQELVACPDIGLVSIAAPPPLHVPMVQACIQAKKAVLCEKPFTLNPSDAMQLLKEAKEAGIVHAMDFEFRDIPAWSLFRNHIQSGVLGPLQSATFHWILGSWADPARPWKWQCDSAQGGGVLSALGVHLFDAVEWMVGPIQSLQATTGITIATRTDETGNLRPVTAEDHADIVMTGENNLPIGMRLSNVDPSGTGLLIQLMGEKGRLILRSDAHNYGSGFSVHEELHNQPSRILFADDTTFEGDARIAPFACLAQRLIQAVLQGDRTFQPSFMTGVRTTTLLDAVRRSEKSGQAESIAATLFYG